MAVEFDTSANCTVFAYKSNNESCQAAKSVQNEDTLNEQDRAGLTPLVSGLLHAYTFQNTLDGVVPALIFEYIPLGELWTLLESRKLKGSVLKIIRVKRPYHRRLDIYIKPPVLRSASKTIFRQIG